MFWHESAQGPRHLLTETHSMIWQKGLKIPRSCIAELYLDLRNGRAGRSRRLRGVAREPWAKGRS